MLKWIKNNPEGEAFRDDEKITSIKGITALSDDKLQEWFGSTTRWPPAPRIREMLRYNELELWLERNKA